MGESFTRSDIERAQFIKQGIKRQEEEKLEEDPTIQLPYHSQIDTAEVDNPHDYPELLNQALKKMEEYAAASFGEVEKRRILEKDLKHEYGHHTAGLGEPGLTIRYGVRFNEDLENRKISFTPLISLAGEARKSVLDHIFSGPEELSQSDKELLK